MFNIKLVLTVIVALGLVVAYLGGNPVVSGFLGSVGDKISFDVTDRNLEFALLADSHDDFEFRASDVNFSIEGFTSADLKTGNLRTNKTVGIHGFTGSGILAGSELVLDGRMVKVQLPEITVSVQETVKSSSMFTRFSAAGLSVKSLVVRNGMITVGNASTSFTGELVITAPKGDFEVFENGTISISGKADRIKIPGSGIVID